MTTSIFERRPDELVDCDDELLDAVLAHWHECLLASSNREAILASLGVDLALATKLGLGLSDRTLGLRIPARQWKAGEILRSRLRAFGVLRTSGHEAFRGCVVTPVIDKARVVALYAQRVDRTRAELWASGLPGGIFSLNLGQSTNRSYETKNLATRAIVTANIPDALALMGAMKVASAEDELTLTTVLAPGRAKGFHASDLKRIATAHREVVVLGRGTGELAQKLTTLGVTVSVTVSVAGAACDVARTLISSATPASALVALWDSATQVTVGESDSAERVEKTPPTYLEVSLDAPQITTPEDTTPEASDHEPSEAPRPPSETTRPEVAKVTRTPGRDELFVSFTQRSWRVRGARLRSNLEGDRLQVALSVTALSTGHCHLDTLDLYGARARGSFLDAATSELHAERSALVGEMLEVLSAAERVRDEDDAECDEAVQMSEAERTEAVAWLKDPDLVANLTRDLGELGVVGEATNLLVCYLATISRKGPSPLGVLVQSTSAGGKSTVVEAVTALVPPEDLVSLSAITSQALYYLGRDALAHKVLYIAEEHGSARAAYALKLLLSEGRLAIAATGKDQRSGRLATRSYVTTGPLALLMTTTATVIDPELENRMIVVGVNEEASQTAAIIAAQRDRVSLAGLRARERRSQIRARHANIQRLLEPMPVVLGEFEVMFPSSATRHRRDHAKLLSLISAVTLLHQHQREIATTEIAGECVSYLSATEADIALGVKLASLVLARSNDNLAPPVQHLLGALEELAERASEQSGLDPYEVRFTRRQMREQLAWSDTQVRRATDRLVELEYLVVAGAGRGRCRTYCLVPEIANLATGVSLVTANDASATSDVVRHVRHHERRTLDPSPSGVTDEFVNFVSSAEIHECGAELTATYVGEDPCAEVARRESR